jgi:O-antigen ligase
MWLHPSAGSLALSESDYLQGNPIERAFLGIMLCAGLIILFKRRDKVAYYFRDNIYVYLFYIYAFMSIGWSEYQGTSFRRWIRATGDAIMVLLILTEDDQIEAIHHTLRRCAILLMPLSIFFIKYYSKMGISYSYDGSRMWTGVTTHKNSLGMFCAFLGIFLTWRLLRGWHKSVAMAIDGLLLVLTVYLLRGSRSSTSVGVFAIGMIMLVLGIYLKRNTRKLSSLVIATFMTLIILQGILVIYFDSSISSLFFSASARDSSFTGRLPVWNELIKIGIQRPILGVGYGGDWRISKTILEKTMFTSSVGVNAHNGYIHVFMDLGLVGLSIILLLIAQTYKKALRSIEQNQEMGILLLSFCLMIVFHNLTESTITRGTSFLWFLFLLSSIVVVKKTNVFQGIGQRHAC